jgi:rare lipoprotein A
VNRLLLGALIGLLLAGCGAQPVKRSAKDHLPLGEAAYDTPPSPSDIPPNLAQIPDAAPREEPKSATGNAPEYEALGETYTVLPSASGYKKRGRASWYGKRFHGRKTASGETYDMFAMSAAHKTLPLPSYVRVTSIKNGHSVVVRVNDRGPFIPDRIIDLSFAAATKLGIIDDGEALVEVEAVTPSRTRGWLQVAIYADAINAVSMREELAGRGVEDVAIWSEAGGSRLVIGPFDSQQSARKVRADLLKQGVPTEWIEQTGAGPERTAAP